MRDKFDWVPFLITEFDRILREDSRQDFCLVKVNLFEFEGYRFGQKKQKQRVSYSDKKVLFDFRINRWILKSEKYYSELRDCDKCYEIECTLEECEQGKIFKVPLSDYFDRLIENQALIRVRDAEMTLQKFNENIKNG